MLPEAQVKALMESARYYLAHPDDKEAARLGIPARNKLIRHNLKLVVSVAKQFKTSVPGLGLEDLIFYGNEGLIKAIDQKVNLERGRFSTGAYYWIYQAIMQAIYWHSRSIRVPVHAWRTRTKINQVSVKLKSELNRAPTQAEVCEATGLSAKKYEANRHSFHTFCEIDETLDAVEPTTEEDPLTTVAKRSVQEALDELETSDEIASSVLKAIYGIDSEELPEHKVAKKFRLSLEEVRAIQARGIASLESIVTKGNYA